MRNAVVEPLVEQLIGGVSQASGVEQGASALAPERQGLGFVGGTLRENLRHRHGLDHRLRGPPFELAACELFDTKPHVALKLGYDPFVLPVVADERLQRPGVLLRVVPTAVLPRGKQPADERPNLGFVRVRRARARSARSRSSARSSSRTTADRDRLSSSTCDPPASVEDGVGDAASQIGDAGAGRLPFTARARRAGWRARTPACDRDTRRSASGSNPDSCLPPTSTFTANACQAVYDGHHPSFSGGGWRAVARGSCSRRA